MWIPRLLCGPQGHCVDPHVTVWTSRSLGGPPCHCVDPQVTVWTSRSLGRPPGHCVDPRSLCGPQDHCVDPKSLWTPRSLCGSQGHCGPQVTVWTPRSPCGPPGHCGRGRAGLLRLQTGTLRQWCGSWASGPASCPHSPPPCARALRPCPPPAPAAVPGPCLELFLRHCPVPGWRPPLARLGSSVIRREGSPRSRAAPHVGTCAHLCARPAPALTLAVVHHPRRFMGI